MSRLITNGAVLLYGDVGDPFGWGDGFTAAEVAEALAEIGGDVVVRINSGGGLAFEGMAIYSLLKAHAGKVTVAIDGVAASAASLIAMGGAVREMRTGAMMMIHEPRGITLGPADAHREKATFLDKLSDQYAAVYAKASGMPKAGVLGVMKAETWLSADEAVKDGFATVKVEDAAAETAAFDYRIYAHAPKSLPVRMKSAAQVVMQAAAPAPAAEVAVAVDAARARMRMRSASLG